jgi:hypothetical protein
MEVVLMLDEGFESHHAQQVSRRVEQSVARLVHTQEVEGASPSSASNNA